jgi:hypothetical protein
MAAPLLASMIPQIGQGLGQVLPYLTLGLFGKKSPQAPLLPKETAQLEALRAQMAQMAIQRQAHLDPMFSALSSGLFNMLPKHFTAGKTPPTGQFKSQFASGNVGMIPNLVRGRSVPREEK